VQYELHVTVRTAEVQPSPEELSKFSALCDEMLGKRLLIQLSCGDYPVQLMMSRRTELDDDPTAIRWANIQAEMIKQQGWDIARVKVEAPFSAKNYGTKPSTVYTEAHWKLFLNSVEKDSLLKFLETHPYLHFKHSWSMLVPGTNYLTVRTTDPDVFRVSSLFSSRGEALLLAGFSTLKFHAERALYDSNPGLDNGWDR